jgi:hypothetical protein
VASDRQIAANRRNAQMSTGPRSEAGKKRASRNAYRHGLAAGLGPSGACAAQIETLAWEIATAATGSMLAAFDAEILAFARIAAQAERDLARMRSAKAASMNSLLTAANWQTTAVWPGAEMDLVAFPGSDQPLFGPSRALAASTLFSSKPRRLTEAIRRPLRELSTLDGYERRATGRRDRAVLQIIARNVLSKANVTISCNWQNEPNFKKGGPQPM